MLQAIGKQYRLPNGVEVNLSCSIGIVMYPEHGPGKKLLANAAADMFADPQFIARQMIESARFPDGKEFKIPGIVPKLTETPGSTEWLGAALGEHTDAVLTELGYTTARIATLRGDGAI